MTKTFKRNRFKKSVLHNPMKLKNKIKIILTLDEIIGVSPIQLIILNMKS